MGRGDVPEEKVRGKQREREREIVEKKSGKGRRGPGKHGRSSCVAKGVLVVDR